MDLMMQRFVLPRIGSLDPALDLNPADAHLISLLGRGGPLPMTAIAQALGLPLSTTSHRVEKLVRKQMVARGRSAQDRRIVEISLTANGLEFERHISSLHSAVSREILKPLTPGERELFVELLTKINSR